MFKVLTLFTFLLVYHSNAANKHDHFGSLFLPENFAVLGNEVFSIPREEQLFSKVIFHYDRLKLILKINFGIAEDQTEKMLPLDVIGGMTIKEICETLPGDPIENFKKFISFSHPNSGASSSDLRKLYVTQEDIRGIWLKTLPESLLRKVYEHYFQTDDIRNWKDLHLSVSNGFLVGESKWRYELFKSIAQEKGAKLKTFHSVPRNKIKKGLNALNGIEFDGIDITSSIFEDMEMIEADRMKNVQADYLQNILDFAFKNDVEVRLHLFEAANTGPFYEILREVLGGYFKPIRLRIGHVNKVTAEWLSFFSRNPNLKIQFDINAASNFWLQSASIPHIIEQTKLIQRYGFATDIGSDGRGILGGSSYLEQINRLYLSGFNYQCHKFYTPPLQHRAIR